MYNQYQLVKNSSERGSKKTSVPVQCTPQCTLFLGNPSVVQEWTGTDRVDVSVQLLVSLIVLH